MSQHDLDIANQTFPNTRSDLNDALQALGSTSSGATVPSTTYANQLWYDTANNKLYIRNEDNDANIEIMELDQSNDTVEFFKSDSVRTALVEYTDGTDALTIGSSGELTTSSTLDVDGNELILDSDGDTSITADTDDQIDIKIAGADDFQFTANTFNVLSGSTLNINSGATITNNGTATGFGTTRKTATPLIINGDMAIDQRNSGASLTITGNDVSCDRWKFQVSQASKLTSEQNDSSGLANFNNYMRITTASAYTPATDEFFIVKQNIEGQNMTFLNFGSSDAQAITLGFYVRSSLTGTFGGAVYNQAGNRNYPFSYTISSANTWEFKTVNISGDTTGTWQKDNSIGMTLLFSLGANATRLNTAGSWTATYSTGATGQVNMIETGSATWDITGVQLEVGTFDSNSIPPFHFEDRGTSLARCQRYYESVSGAYLSLLLIRSSGYLRAINYPYKVNKRVAPTVTLISATTDGVGNLAPGSATVDNVRFSCDGGETSGPRVHDFTMDAEL